MNLDTLRPQLECLFRQRPVQLAYLFGSQATGHTHADSDVDIAVLINEGLTVDERFAERLALIGALSQVFRTDTVDVVVLNEASPLLAYEALRHGVLLYCAEENARVEFQVRTLRAYEEHRTAAPPARRSNGRARQGRDVRQTRVDEKLSQAPQRMALNTNTIRQRLHLSEGYVQHWAD